MQIYSRPHLDILRQKWGWLAIITGSTARSPPSSYQTDAWQARRLSIPIAVLPAVYSANR